ncbi:MAG: insulinase family protein [Gammaproteobacteria bacterium]|nr:insulinase family protein [Gammaproteobacteria bacterium]
MKFLFNLLRRSAYGAKRQADNNFCLLASRKQAYKYILTLFLLLFSTFSFATVNIQQWQTTNGVRVLFIASPQNPILDLAVVFKAGSVYDGKNSGLAQLTNAMLNEGAGDLSADQLADQFANVGAQFSNDVTTENGRVSIRTLTEPNALNSSLQTLELILAHPTLPQTSIDRIKKEMLVGLEYQLQQPDYVARKVLSKAVWGDSPYANPLDGTPTSIPTLTRTAVQDFYRQYYGQHNCYIAMVGALTTAQAKTIAEQVAKSLPAGSVPELFPAPTLQPASTQHIPFNSTQTAILIGTLGITSNDPDYFPLTVGNTILGGGMNSILFRKVREQAGLTYGITSSWLPLTKKGVFVINLKTRNQEAVKATQMTEQLLKQYWQNGPTTKEVQAAKQFLIGSFALSISNNAALLSDLVYIANYDLPLDYLNTVQYKLAQVTQAQIKTAWQKHIHLDHLAIVTVGNL